MIGERPDGGPSSRTGGDGRRVRRLARSRMGRLGLAVFLVALGAGVAMLVVHGSGGRAPARAVPLGTARVHRGDLIETQRYRGRLSYPSRGSVHLSGPGTVTSLPHVGQLLTEGAAVAGVDDRPIGVLFGAAPLYRTLGAANTFGARLAVQSAQANLLAAQATLSQTARSPDPGRGGSGGGSGGSDSESGGVASSPTRSADVAQAQVSVDEARERLLEAQRALRSMQAPQQGPDVALVAGNMTALGYYRGFTDSWSAALQDAVRQWQDHIGATPSGDIDPDDVLVVRGGARVTGVQGGLGDAPSAVTISLSSPSRVATFRLRNGVPGALARGRRVRLSAGGHATTGRVTSVHTSGQSASVQVALDRSSKVARTGSTRVTMSVTIADRRDVLTVPTQALLALASGGYALQLPDGRLLAVRTGVVQGADIEVSGRGVHEGLRVVAVT